MYEGTRDDYKQYSPFWGMVAFHGHMLEIFRFFGNYDTRVTNDRDEDGNPVLHETDEGREPIATLIKELFNSPDGVQFVPTTYPDSPAGILSKNLYLLNDIIQILLEPTDEKEVVGVKELEDTNKLINEEDNKNRNQLEEIQKKLISKLEKQEREYLKEESNKIRLQMKINSDSRKANQQKIKELKNLAGVSHLSYEEKIANKKKVIAEKIQSVTEIHTLTPFDLDEKKNRQIEESNKRFATILVNAHELEKKLANPELHNSYLYPPNIVITTLLAFYVSIADDKRQIKKDLPFLMYDGFNDRSVFTQEMYLSNKKNLNKIIENQIEDPEMAFLMALGYANFEAVFAEPINYLGNTPYMKYFFPDCGETSLRNVLGIFLSAFTKGLITDQALDSLMNKINSTDKSYLREGAPFMNMIAFLKKNQNMSLGALTIVHTEWAEVVSNLNEDVASSTLNDVQYGRSLSQEQPNTYEIKANVHPEVKGIVNMFNVIAKLIPDDVLAEPWLPDHPRRLEQVAKKLNRFCELLSRNEVGLNLSWKNEKTNKQTIDNEFVHIIFMNGNNPLFKWQFEKSEEVGRGHFQLDYYTNGENDWRYKYRTADETLFPNEWMASLYLRTDEPTFLSNENYGVKYPLSRLFNRDIRGVNGAITALTFAIYKNRENGTLSSIYPLMNRWIKKSIPFNDAYSLRKIALLMYSCDDLDFIKNIMKQRNFEPIKKEVDSIAQNNDVNPLQLAADNGLCTILYWISKKPVIKMDLNISDNRIRQHANLNKITDAVLAKITTLVSLNLSANFTITNTGIQNLTKLESLNLTLNPKITDAGIQNLINLTSLNLVQNSKITDAGIQNLTNLISLNLQNNDKITNTGLGNLVNLKHLDLVQNTKITDAGIKHLTNLANLNLSYNAEITDVGIQNLTKLESLNLSFNLKITDAGIQNLTNLASLNLRNNKLITDAGIKKLTNLTSLNLVNVDFITNTGLGNLVNLKDLNLQINDRITDEGLKDLTKLESLDLNLNSKITDAGIQNLTNLKNLNLRANSFITDAGIQNLTNLRSLNLNFNSRITDASLVNLRNIESLYLSGNNTITDGALGKLPNLTILDLSSNYEITDAGIQNLTNLRNLNLSENRKITEIGLSKLARLTHLNLLRNDVISGLFIKNLKKNNPDILITSGR